MNLGFLNQGMFLNNNPTEILSSLLRLHPQVLQTQNPTYGMPKNEFPSSGAVKRRHSSTVSTVSMNSTSNYSPNFNDNCIFLINLNYKILTTEDESTFSWPLRYRLELEKNISYIVLMFQKFIENERNVYKTDIKQKMVIKSDLLCLCP